MTTDIKLHTIPSKIEYAKVTSLFGTQARRHGGGGGGQVPPMNLFPSSSFLSLFCFVLFCFFFACQLRGWPCPWWYYPYPIMIIFGKILKSEKKMCRSPPLPPPPLPILPKQTPWRRPWLYLTSLHGSIWWWYCTSYNVVQLTILLVEFSCYSVSVYTSIS